MKKFIPTYYCSTNLFDIDISFFKKINIHYILADLDNTLDSYKLKEASSKTKEYIAKLKENNIDLIIISNNNNERVKKYADSLNVKYLAKAGKPFKKKIQNYLINNNIEDKNCIIIGDQLMTDIKCANKLKIKSLLVEDLVKENQLVTKFNKFFDRIVRKKLKKKNKLKDWRD